MKPQEKSSKKKAVKRKEKGTATGTTAKARAGNGKKSKKPERTPAPQRVTPDPLTFSLTLPAVTVQQTTPVRPDPLALPLSLFGEARPFDSDGTLRRALWSLRNIPRHDLGARSAEAAKLKAFSPQHIEQLWRTGYRERVLSEVHTGRLDTLHYWLHSYGPDALQLAHAEPAIGALLRDWFIDGALGDETARAQLITTLERVSKPHLPRDPEYSLQERTQRRQQQTTKAKRRFRGKQNKS